MAKKNKEINVEPRSAGRREVSTLRAKINSMNSTQQKSFFAGFKDDDFARVQKSIDRVVAGNAKKEIEKAEAEIVALQEKIKALKG